MTSASCSLKTNHSKREYLKFEIAKLTKNSPQNVVMVSVN